MNFWDMSKRKTEMPVELNYIKIEMEKAVKGGRDGGREGERERVKQTRQLEGCSLSFM